MVFAYKRGDTAPPLRVTFRERDGSPVDLTGASARFLMRSGGATTTINAPATIVSAPRGEVEYRWGPLDLASIGRYKAEMEATLPDGRKRTHPPHGYLFVHVGPDLG